MSSLKCWTINIAQLLGADRLDAALRNFGFGTTSSVNFPGESGGVMLARKNYSDTSMITIPIGYGLAVTPMQMLDVYVMIANGGVPVQPRLLPGDHGPNIEWHPGWRAQAACS